MTTSEIFIQEQTVTPAGELAYIEVTNDWEVRYAGLSLDFDPEAALCLSAILSLPDKLTTSSDRSELILETYALAKAQNMSSLEMFDLLTGDVNRKKQLAAESILLRRPTPLLNYFIRVGHVGAKMILFCRNMSNVETGIQIVSDFAESKMPEHKTKFVNEFSREFRKREIEYERRTLAIDLEKLSKPNVRSPENKGDEGPQGKAPSVVAETKASSTRARSRKKATRTDANPVPISIPSEPSDKQPQEKKFNDVKEYSQALFDYLMIIDSPFDMNDLVDWVVSIGFEPKPSDIEEVFNIAKNQTNFTKTFLSKPKGEDKMKFVRIK